MLCINPRHMRLTDIPEKIKNIPDIAKNTFVFLIVLLVGFGSFTLGRISAFEDSRINAIRVTTSSALAGVGAVDPLAQKTAETSSSSGRMESQQTQNLSQMKPMISLVTQGKYLGSKNGSVYHLPTCPGAKRIKDENKVWFASKAEAEARGYKPAVNCKGI